MMSPYLRLLARRFWILTFALRMSIALIINHGSHVNSSFTDLPLVKLPPEVAPRHNTGYSYAHEHIAQINNTREHCVHITDHSGWRFSTTHVMKYLQ